MSLPELMVAVAMLVAFTGIFVMVTTFTTRFFTGSDNSQGGRSVFIEQQLTLMYLDRLAEILSQPGYTKNEIIQLTQNCTYPPNPPGTIMNLPGVEDLSPPPPGFKVCLFTTSLTESSLEDLILRKEGAQPGIYILFASPPENQISMSELPVRRLFCRPKPYC